MANALQKTELSPAQQIGHYLTNKTSLIQSALPQGQKAERFIQIALSAIMRNPALAHCTPLSFFSSVQWLAQMGLEPGGPDQLAYLVPYKDQCTPQVGYRGMIQIALNEGSVKKINAVVVYANDFFDYEEGIQPILKHKPLKDGDRGPMKYVYAYAVLPSGETQFIVMNEADINKHKAKSLAARSEKESINMWRDFPESAWKKTALRELYKFLPHNQKLSMAVERDINAEKGQNIDFKPVTIDDLGKLPTKSEQIADELSGATDAEIVTEEDHTLDEIVRLAREAQSALDLAGPKAMIARLKNEKDKNHALKIIEDREASFRGGKK